MDTWVDRVNFRASLLIDQIVAAHKVGETFSLDIGDGMADLYRKKLADLYRDELPLAQLLDNSDLVFHAEGPSAHHGLPDLHAVNWLIGTAEKQLRNLAKALFDLNEPATKRIGREVDLRLTGFAPGSLYAGVRIEPPEDTMLEAGADSLIYIMVRDAIRGMPAIPGFVEDEALSDAIFSAIPDPAQRDAGLTAAFELSPTGQLGIHTLQLFAPGDKPAQLSQRERVVLRDALRHPKLGNRHNGSFIGEIREIDLDKKRFHLRNIPNIGAIRCVWPKDREEGNAKSLLGNTVKVSGDYETDTQGKPRLMLVADIKLITQSTQSSLLE